MPCGLWDDWPYCEGSHHSAKDEEGVLCAYSEEGGELVAREVDEDPGTCDVRT